jgi:hypothetical protein
VPARAQAPPTVEGGAFLLVPVGARATALGQAAVADGGSTEALYWNPAGLAALATSELALHHYTAFFGHGDAVVLGLRVNGLGSFAAAAYVVDYGDLDVTAGDPDPIGRITPRNLALAVAWAGEVLDGILAGLAYKLVQFRVDCSGACANIPTAVGTTHAVDLGVQWAIQAGIPIVVGASLRNVGFKLQVNNQAQADPLPARFVVGVQWRVVRPPAGIEGLDLRLLTDVQSGVGAAPVAPAPLVGVEAGLGSKARVRAGYAFVESTNRGPSLGVGFTLGRVVVDLAKTFYATDAVGDEEPVHFSLRLAL